MFHHRGTEGAEAGKKEWFRIQDPEPFFLSLRLRVLCALCGENSGVPGATAVLDRRAFPQVVLMSMPPTFPTARTAVPVMAPALDY
jgi:hypothetical protein